MKGGYLSRSACLFLGLYALANLIRALVAGGTDENVVWVDLRWLPGPLKTVVLGVAGWLLAAHGLAPAARGLRRAAARGVALFLFVAAAHDILRFANLANGPGFSPAVPVPFSLFVLLVVGAMVKSLYSPNASRPGTLRRTVFGALLVAGAFPLVHMGTFGGSDYRRPADAAVVFGARVYADGTPSTALADRVRAACDLYHEGHVDHLLMSGGPGDAEVHEVEAMQALAIRLGVPGHAVHTDREGLSTTATVRNACRIASQKGWGKLLAVSHAWHLSRVKMAFRQEGRPASTVPARDTLPRKVMARLMLREVAAYWAVWLGV